MGKLSLGRPKGGPGHLIEDYFPILLYNYIILELWLLAA